MELLTISRLKSYRACPRRHLHEYVHGARPVVPAPALRFGTALHAALELYWCARRDTQRGQPWSEPAYDAALRGLALAGLDPVDLVRATVLLTAYCTAWDPREVTVLAVEQEWRMPLVNPRTGFDSPSWNLAGKIDLLLRLEDGRVAIVEHKTTSSDPGPGGEYRDRLQLDGQVSLYFAAAEALGYAPDVVLYDVLVKPTSKLHHATPLEKVRVRKDGAPYSGQRMRDETIDEYRLRVFCDVCDHPEKYLVQIEVPRLDDEREESALDVWQTAGRMREDARAGVAPRNPDACHRYGSACPYLPVCQRRASIDDPTLYTLGRAHPELNTDPASTGDTAPDATTAA